MSLITHNHKHPTPQDAKIAHQSGQILSRYIQRENPLKLCVMDDESQQPLHLPSNAVVLLIEILEAMAAGQGVTIIPENAELSTAQAADVLNVSRPYLIKLLESNHIPYRKVGKHRRVRMEDVMAYKKAIDAEREEILDQLVAEAQAQDMGY